MYIGQTCRSFDIRWKQHCADSFNSNSRSYNDHFHKAIRLYGIDN
nr:MAG TPA: intron associated endonuclease [Caudoviricetes sp.]